MIILIRGADRAARNRAGVSMLCVLNGQCMWVREEGKKGGKDSKKLFSCECAVRPSIPAMPKDFFPAFYIFFHAFVALWIFNIQLSVASTVLFSPSLAV